MATQLGLFHTASLPVLKRAKPTLAPAKPAAPAPAQPKKVRAVERASLTAVAVKRDPKEVSRIAAEKAEIARAAERERLDKLRVGVDEVSPHEDALVVRFYNRGWRSHIVVGVGRKWATMF